MSKISQKFRHEWKHEINNADIVILRQRLSAVMQKDPNAENGKYSIRSLYFDNLYDKALLEKLNGINRREKFRIRIYNSDFSFIKLEKKSKINGLCLKETELLTKEEAEKIINSDFDFMKSSKKPLIKELCSKMESEGLRPKTIVDYIREPFVFPAGNVRVTLDYNIRTGLYGTDIFDPDLPTLSAGTNAVLSMLPWDYNLAFGTFMGGNADSSVNDPIDSPLSVSGSGDRPMADWIFQSEEYTGLYHQYFAEFLETVDISAIIEDAEELIAPYVEKDPTKFCSFEEFEHGVATLKEFCSLRAQSIENQLSEGENFTEVDASSLDLSAMGTMSMGGKGGFDRNSGGMNDRLDKTNTTNNSDPPMPSFGAEMPPNFSIDGNFSKPDSESGETFPGSFPAFSLSNIILLVLSLIILPAAIIFAIKYKRR